MNKVDLPTSTIEPVHNTDQSISPSTPRLSAKPRRQSLIRSVEDSQPLPQERILASEITFSYKQMPLVDTSGMTYIQNPEKAEQEKQVAIRTVQVSFELKKLKMLQAKLTATQIETLSEDQRAELVTLNQEIADREDIVRRLGLFPFPTTEPMRQLIAQVRTQLIIETYRELDTLCEGKLDTDAIVESLLSLHKVFYTPEMDADYSRTTQLLASAQPDTITFSKFDPYDLGQYKVEFTDQLGQKQEVEVSLVHFLRYMATDIAEQAIRGKSSEQIKKDSFLSPQIHTAITLSEKLNKHGFSLFHRAANGGAWTESTFMQDVRKESLGLMLAKIHQGEVEPKQKLIDALRGNGDTSKINHVGILHGNPMKTADGKITEISCETCTEIAATQAKNTLKEISLEKTAQTIKQIQATKTKPTPDRALTPSSKTVAIQSPPNSPTNAIPLSKTAIPFIPVALGLLSAMSAINTKNPAYSPQSLMSSKPDQPSSLDSSTPAKTAPFENFAKQSSDRVVQNLRTEYPQKISPKQASFAPFTPMERPAQISILPESAPSSAQKPNSTATSSTEVVRQISLSREKIQQEVSAQPSQPSTVPISGKLTPAPSELDAVITKSKLENQTKTQTVTSPRQAATSQDSQNMRPAPSNLATPNTIPAKDKAPLQRPKASLPKEQQSKPESAQAVNPQPEVQNQAPKNTLTANSPLDAPTIAVLAPQINTALPPETVRPPKSSALPTQNEKQSAQPIQQIIQPTPQMQTNPSIMTSSRQVIEQPRSNKASSVAERRQSVQASPSQASASESTPSIKKQPSTKLYTQQNQSQQTAQESNLTIHKPAKTTKQTSPEQTTTAQPANSIKQAEDRTVRNHQATTIKPTTQINTATTTISPESINVESAT